jgi:hypothetical protein
VTCKTYRGELEQTTTEYNCVPADACHDDVRKCTPIGRTRGTVPPGGRCTHITKPEAAKFELGDDCAPTEWITAGAPKGSWCVMESGPGAYCTHDCAAPEACADLVRDGYFGECSGGTCLLTRK